MAKELFGWQAECLDIWEKNGCRGIVSAVTGGGKTVLAIGAAKRLAESLRARGQELKVRVIVPKTFLVSQWRNAILEETGISRSETGCYFGAHKDDPSARYMIYVLNSARFSLSRHILADIKKGVHILLIVDECHHCAGEINARIFDFVPRLGGDADRYYALALSATADKIANDPRFTEALGGIIYRYGLNRALAEGVVSDFIMLHVSVRFLEEEWKEFESLSILLTRATAAVKKLYPALRRLEGAAFFARLQALVARGDKIGDAAARVLRLAYRRREISHLAENRIACACGLVARMPENSRVILFGERIECARRIYERLRTALPGQTAMYHSGMDRDIAANALARYRSGEVRVLVGCRALDEGLDVPETDVGIVVSSSRTELQKIQRLGRILRRKDSLLPAKLYYLSLEEDGEETYIDGEFEDVFLCYDGENDRFDCPEQVEKAVRVLSYAQEKGASPRAMGELMKNIELCFIRGDAGLSPEQRRAMREGAESLAERNYWTAALLLERSGNL